MRRAQTGQGVTAAEAAEPRKRTGVDRERIIANEAWLRRVPDDPGGLLRAKFKLEQRRRRREGDR
jgi:Ca-activated chloride channel family protein